MKIEIKTESHAGIVSSPVICGISIDGVMSQNDVRDALSEIDKFAEMFFNKHINKYGNEPDPHDFCANARANDMSNAGIGMAKEIEHLREENRELRESNDPLRIINRGLRKDNAELKDWNDKLNECCNSLESEVQMLKAKIYDLINKEK